MAITINTQPSDYGRVYDTNRLMYKLTSTNYSEVNFRYYIGVFVSTPDEDPESWTSIAIIRKRPLSDGSCFFNPAELWSIKLSSDLTIDVDGLTECLNSNAKFRIAVQEEYGIVPTQISPSLVESDIITLYNGLQEYIPYDIEAYGGGNNQFVMRPEEVTSSSSWVACGNFYSRTGISSLVGTIKFIDAAGDGIGALTSIEITYLDKDNTNQMGAINGMSTGEQIIFVNPASSTEYMIITFGTKTDSANTTTLTDITLAGTGPDMASTGFVDETEIELMYINIAGQLNGDRGKFLTDALSFKVGDDDYGNLYFLSTDDRPATAQIKVKYWSDGASPVNVGGGSGSNVALGSYTNNSGAISRTYNTAESAPNYTPRSADPGPSTEHTARPPVFHYKDMISTYTTGFTLSYTNDNNNMYYIPTGPKELAKMGLFDIADADGGWVSYEINLTDTINNPSYIYNEFPMTYYKTNKCNKYGPWQLFWLNPHGGYDTYTFNKKNYIQYEVSQTRWQHRFSDTYVLGERGTTVYKTLANKKVVLNTEFLTASESQILSQLNMSPEIYAVYDYQGVIYKIPYVIDDTSFQYKDVKNEKMVVMEITIVPAWNRVSQTS